MLPLMCKGHSRTEGGKEDVLSRAKDIVGKRLPNSQMSA